MTIPTVEPRPDVEATAEDAAGANDDGVEVVHAGVGVGTNARSKLWSSRKDCGRR